METAAESGDLLRALQERGEKQPKKDERFKGKSDKILHKRKRQCSQRWEPQTLGSRCHFLPTVVHTSMTVQQLSPERGSEAALKKKKSFALIWSIFSLS